VGADGFNGDHKNDILWQEQTTGCGYLWLMDGATMISGLAVGSPNGRRVRAVGGRGEDASPDLFSQHPTTGNVMSWMTNGTTVGLEGSLAPGGLGTMWFVATPADVTADGGADHLAQ